MNLGLLAYPSQADHDNRIQSGHIPCAVLGMMGQKMTSQTYLLPIRLHCLVKQECLHQRAGQDLNPFADLVRICSSASCLNWRNLSHHVSIFICTSSRPCVLKYPKTSHHIHLKSNTKTPNHRSQTKTKTPTPKKTKQKPKHQHPKTTKQKKRTISTMGRIRTCDHPCSSGPRLYRNECARART